jgi:hypothetical protein
MRDLLLGWWSVATDVGAGPYLFLTAITAAFLAGVIIGALRRRRAQVLELPPRPSLLHHAFRHEVWSYPDPLAPEQVD